MDYAIGVQVNFKNDKSLYFELDAELATYDTYSKIVSNIKHEIHQAFFGETFIKTFYSYLMNVSQGILPFSINEYSDRDKSAEHSMPYMQYGKKEIQYTLPSNRQYYTSVPLSEVTSVNFFLNDYKQYEVQIPNPDYDPDDEESEEPEHLTRIEDYYSTFHVNHSKSAAINNGVNGVVFLGVEWDDNVYGRYINMGPAPHDKKELMRFMIKMFMEDGYFIGYDMQNGEYDSTDAAILKYNKDDYYSFIVEDAKPPTV